MGGGRRRERGGEWKALYQGFSVKLTLKDSSKFSPPQTQRPEKGTFFLKKKSEKQFQIVANLVDKLRR